MGQGAIIMELRAPGTQGRQRTKQKAQCTRGQPL